MQPRPERTALHIAFDTTFAGTNPSGVGLYSRRLVQHVSRAASGRGLVVSCFGASCSGAPRHDLAAILSEWPVNTQLFLPLRLLLSGPKIVHSTSHLGPLWGRARRVVTVHDLIFHHYPSDYNSLWLAITRALLPKVLRRASAVVVDSHATRSDLLRLYRIDPAKVRVIYPGLDPVQTTSVRDLSQHGGYILCPGPLVPRKNIEVVVRAFAAIADKHKTVKLVITGERPRGMSISKLDSELSQLPADVRGRVCLTGYVTRARLDELLTGASVLAYPSKMEGFGFPPLEAMQRGIPVVASRATAVVETSGPAAILVDAESYRQWASALEKVLENYQLRSDLRELGLLHCRQFTWTRCAEEAIELYREIAGDLAPSI